MKITTLRVLLSAFTLYSIFVVTTVSINAAPVRYSQVVQVVNAKPGKANTGGFTQLRVLGNDNLVSAPSTAGSDDDTKKADTPPQPQQTERVIVETRTDIIEDDACDCPPPPVGGGFPKYALLGLAAIPFLFLIPHGDKDTPTPTPTTPGNTPTPTPPGDTPTPTPTTPTPTPPGTPTPPMTPTPEPVPEPVTILLFGSGLAGIGVAARRRFRKSDEKAGESESKTEE